MNPAMLSDKMKDVMTLEKQIEYAVKETCGVSAKVKLVEPGSDSEERGQGEAGRGQEERKDLMRLKKMVKQISIFLANEPGILAKALEILAREKVDIRALTVAETIDFGLLRLMVDDPEKAVSALNKGGMSAIEHEVLAVEVSDEPGGLYRITRILADAKINIEYVYAFVSRNKDKAYVVLRTDELKKTEEVLKKSSVRIVGEKEMEDI